MNFKLLLVLKAVISSTVTTVVRQAWLKVFALRFS